MWSTIAPAPGSTEGRKFTAENAEETETRDEWKGDEGMAGEKQTTVYCAPNAR